MRLRVPLTLLLLAVMSACGTTVPLASRSAGAGQTSVAEGSVGPVGADADGSGLATATGDGASGVPVTGVGGAPLSGGPAGPVGDAAQSVGGPASPRPLGPSGPVTAISGPAGPAAGRPTKVPANGSHPATKPGTQPAVSAKPTAANASGQSGGQTSGPGPAANAPGVTPTTIEVGYVYTKNAAAAQAALGANVNTGDPIASANAVVAYINAHGGIAGRKLHLDTYATDAESTDSTASQEQAVCSHFSDDTKVFAVVNAHSGSSSFRTCLSQHGIAAIGSGLDQLGTADFAATPTYVDTGVETTQGVMRNLVTALANDGYDTTKWDTTNGAPGGALPVKFGIILPNLPRWTDAVNNVLVPALRKRGITIDASDIYSYQFPASSADNGATVSQIQSAVLQFRADNVTNVIPVEVNGLVFFSTGANSQKYYPRYGVTSSTEAEIGVTSGLIPAQQLVGAVGFGWSPEIDLADAGNYGSAGLSLCEKINSDAGNGLSGNVAIALAAAVCDQLFIVQAGVNKIPSGQGITAANFAPAVRTLGTSFPIAIYPTANFTAGNPSPVSQGWAWAWDTGCSCMKYVGAGYGLS